MSKPLEEIYELWKQRDPERQRVRETETDREIETENSYDNGEGRSPGSVSASAFKIAT